MIARPNIGRNEWTAAERGSPRSSASAAQVDGVLRGYPGPSRSPETGASSRRAAPTSVLWPRRSSREFGWEIDEQPSPLCLVGADKTVRLWRSTSGEAAVLIRGTPLDDDGHSDDVTCLAFPRHGMRVLSGSRDRTLRLWDAESGALLVLYDARRLDPSDYEKTIDGHALPLTCCEFSRDGLKILSASADGTVKVWGRDTGAVERSFRGDGRAAAAAFVRDARRVLVARGSDVQYLDAVTGDVLSRYDAGGDVTCVAPSPVDRLTFAAATARGAIHRVRVHHDPG